MTTRNMLLYGAIALVIGGIIAAFVLGADRQPPRVTGQRVALVGAEATAEEPGKTAVVDPVDDPGGFANQARSAFRAGQWALLVVLVLFGVSRALVWGAQRWAIPWLTRATPAITVASGILAAVAAGLVATGGVDWGAILGAIGAAAMLYLRPDAKPAAEPAAPAVEGP